MATKKMPEWFVADYEAWKKIAWRGFRAFVAGFISGMALLLITATPEDFTSWENAQKFLIPVGMGAVSGGLVALGKTLRDAFPESEIINKLPI